MFSKYSIPTILSKFPKRLAETRTFPHPLPRSKKFPGPFLSNPNDSALSKISAML